MIGKFVFNRIRNRIKTHLRAASVELHIMQDSDLYSDLEHIQSLRRLIRRLDYAAAYFRGLIGKAGSRPLPEGFDELFRVWCRLCDAEQSEFERLERELTNEQWVEARNCGKELREIAERNHEELWRSS